MIKGDTKQSRVLNFADLVTSQTHTWILYYQGRSQISGLRERSHSIAVRGHNARKVETPLEMSG